jgi:hypothetical protein
LNKESSDVLGTDYLESGTGVPMYKPSALFTIKKIEGREFELAMIPHLEEAGLRVIDVDHWSYNQKKGRDVIVETQGHRNSIEMKYDRMSEKTGQICIDLDSINKTVSHIWIYGLPEGEKVHTYTMRITDLAPFARNWPIRRCVGEFSQPVALVPKSTFLAQKFVYPFKIINLN